MSRYKNLCLENITEYIDGVLHVEKWQSVEGYEGKYEISSFGRIKSLGRLRSNGTGKYFMNTKIIKPFLQRDGYLLIDFGDKSYLVHRLVGFSFIERTDMDLDEINHKDRVKINNFYLNLEWTNRKNNMVHASVNGSYDNMPKGSKHWNKKFTEEEVVSILKSKENGYTLSKIYNVDHKTIYNILKRKTWTHIQIG